MSPVRKIVSRMTFAYIAGCTLFLGSRCVNDNSSKVNKPLGEEASELTEQIKIQGLSPELEEEANRVTGSIKTKHRKSNDSFYSPSPRETMELVKLRQTVNQAKR